MQIIHVMKDGTVRDSLDGLVIPNGEFYQVLQGIIEKRRTNEARTKANKRAEKTHRIKGT
jgi:hypothetical protein